MTPDLEGTQQVIERAIGRRLGDGIENPPVGPTGRARGYYPAGGGVHRGVNGPQSEFQQDQLVLFRGCMFDVLTRLPHLLGLHSHAGPMQNRQPAAAETRYLIVVVSTGDTRVPPRNAAILPTNASSSGGPIPYRRSPSGTNPSSSSTCSSRRSTCSRSCGGRAGFNKGTLTSFIATRRVAGPRPI